jgi:hypothetical protein
MYYIERAATQRTVESVHAAWKDQTDREEVCVCAGGPLGAGQGPEYLCALAARSLQLSQHTLPLPPLRRAQRGRRRLRLLFLR